MLVKPLVYFVFKKTVSNKIINKMVVKLVNFLIITMLTISITRILDDSSDLQCKIWYM